MPSNDPAASQDVSPTPVGKSTLQRWAKTWGALGTASPVKSILVTTRTGAAYRVDRDDFTAWLIEQKQNMRPGERLKDPVISQETSRGPEMSRKTSQDPERHHETSRDPSGSQGNSRARTHTFSNGVELDDGSSLRDENMQMKIDVEVRKQLLNQAAGEINRQRDQIEKLLRENGGLQSQVLQLSPPSVIHHPTLMASQTMHEPADEQSRPIDHDNGDNPPFGTNSTL